MTTTEPPTIAQIAARARAATGGTWEWEPYGQGGQALIVRHDILPGVPGHPINILKTTNDWPPARPDATFIAHARADILHLLTLLPASCPDDQDTALERLAHARIEHAATHGTTLHDLHDVAADLGIDLTATDDAGERPADAELVAAELVATLEWANALPVHDRHEMATELTTLLRAGAATGSFTDLADALHDWHATALIHADPHHLAAPAGHDD